MPPEGEQLWRQYEIAVEEYRFQVELNWKRSQYYFVINAVVLATAIGLISASSPVSRQIVGALFGLGLVMAVLSMMATVTQNSYYRAAREQMKFLSKQLALCETALNTTPGQGSAMSRVGRVTTFQFTMLGAMAVANLLGMVIAFFFA